MPTRIARQLALPLPVVAAGPEADPHSGAEQRWRDGRHSWVRPEDGGFTPARYRVSALDERSAKAFVLRHHYARSFPAAVLRYGMYLREDPSPSGLVGVAVYSVPMQAKVLTRTLPRLTPYAESLELGRFVMEGDRQAPGAPPGRAPANSESWFIAQTFRLLAEQGVRAVVAFCDPVPRSLDAGATLWPGHYGTIYQASNAIYTGRGTSRLLTVLPDGTALSARVIAKVDNQEIGHAYVERRLLQLGATARPAGTAPAAWLRQALADIGAVRLQHRGNHRYVMGTASGARRRLHLGYTALPYPKGTDAAGAARPLTFEEGR